jgi:hypothetical protein
MRGFRCPNLPGSRRAYRGITGFAESATQLTLTLRHGTGYGDGHEIQQGVLRNAFELRGWRLGGVSSDCEPFWKRGYAKFDAEFQHSLDGSG